MPNHKADKDLFRITLTLKPNLMQRLEEMRLYLKVKDDAAVFRRALQILEALIEDEKNGKKAYVQNPTNGQIVPVRIR